jgi:PAS domain S-box-containing protein
MTQEENANASDSNENKSATSSENTEDSGTSPSENKNVDVNNPSNSNEDIKVNPSENKENIEENPHETDEHHDTNPTEKPEDNGKSQQEGTENTATHSSEANENIEENQQESAESHDVNPPEKPEDNQESPQESIENKSTPLSENSENEEGKQQENIEQHDSNPPEEPENNDESQQEGTENTGTHPTDSNEVDDGKSQENQVNDESSKKESHEDNEVEATKRRQEFFERIIENAPSMIIGVDLQCDIMFFNGTAEYITGYSNDEALGNNFLSLLLQKRERTEIGATFNDVVEGKGIFTVENLIITKEGEERLISWSIGAAINNENMIIGSICIGNDITDREVIQEMEELRILNTDAEDLPEPDIQSRPMPSVGPGKLRSEANKEWENVFDSIVDPIIIVGKENRILKVNSAFGYEMNCDPNELIGKTCCEIFHDERSPIHSCVHKKTIQSEEAETDEVYDPRSGNTTLISCSPYYNENGELMGSVLIAKEVKGSIGPKNTDDADKMIGIRTLVSAIQHEINNPLGGVLGNAEAIFEEDNPIKIRIYASDIIEASRRLSELSDSLVRSIQKTQGPELNTMDLNDFIKSSLEDLKYDKKFEKVEVECDLNTIPKIQGNPAEILEVFINILSNSIESMEGPGKIKISTRKSNGDVQMIFTDNGAGIPEEHLSRIFDPLYAVENDDVRDEAVSMKTGLRMYVVSSILKKYNAPINIESEAGKGTSYIINFPYKGDKEQNT